ALPISVARPVCSTKPHAIGMGKHLVEPNEHQPKAPIWRTRVELSAVLMLAIAVLTFFGFRWLITDQPATKGTTLAVDQDGVEDSDAPFDDPAKPNDAEERSEERRVGKECRGEG